mmetsp:Transcript_12920/g.32298  ORF Transcript_12920/g.32298 Transcript_12920/m.32298 type:complete len:243 (-) Transcript_12920:808-1536(-)
MGAPRVTPLLQVAAQGLLDVLGPKFVSTIVQRRGRQDHIALWARVNFRAQALAAQQDLRDARINQCKTPFHVPLDLGEVLLYQYSSHLESGLQRSTDIPVRRIVPNNGGRWGAPAGHSRPSSTSCLLHLLSMPNCLPQGLGLGSAHLLLRIPESSNGCTKRCPQNRTGRRQITGCPVDEPQTSLQSHSSHTAAYAPTVRSSPPLHAVDFVQHFRQGVLVQHKDLNKSNSHRWSLPKLAQVRM